MKTFRFAILCGWLAAYGLSAVGTAEAQTEFQLALRKKHNFRSVLCTTCHVVGKEKTERNEFGSLLAKELKGKNVTPRLDKVKDLEVEDPARVKVKEEVTKEFLEALDKVEKMAGPGGVKYVELLKAGKMEGTKLKE